MSVCDTNTIIFLFIASTCQYLIFYFYAAVWIAFISTNVPSTFTPILIIKSFIIIAMSTHSIFLVYLDRVLVYSYPYIHFLYVNYIFYFTILTFIGKIILSMFATVLPHCSSLSRQLLGITLPCGSTNVR